jgi:hypothetical protein
MHDHRLIWGIALVAAVPFAVACGGSTDPAATAAAPAATATASPTPTATAGPAATDTPSFVIGGSVQGLVGAGLALKNGSETLAVAKDGTFAFASRVSSGAAYAVSVVGQPSGPTQACVVAGGAGAVAQADVTGISVTCTTSRFTVGGTVSGLHAAGLVLQNEAGDDLAVAAAGTFAFASPVASGAPFAVTVKTQPAGATCAVSGGSGTIGAAAVSSVSVSCEPNAYTVGGTVDGLVGTLVLANGDDQVVVAANGAFAFPTPVKSGSTYAVKVTTQPSQPNQTCEIAGGAGDVAAANVDAVKITCTTTSYGVAVTASGVTSPGLVLQDNGGDDLAIDADGDYRFATAITDGQVYAVTVAASPPGLRCAVTEGSGVIAGADVAGIAVSCAPIPSFAISVSVVGLQGSGLVLQDNGGADVAAGADGVYVFASPVLDGQPYAVTVLQNPANPDQVCTVDNGAGNVAGADVANVVVTCQ